ncbi:MAG: TonB-dependent receptor [Gemmatimonadetes bacterium]|nr:TonB-dependent receptor [Gemmatimonadota bacterium]
MARPLRRSLITAAALFLTLLIAPSAEAQTIGSIIGRVVDATTGEGIEAVTIEVTGTSLRGLSGADGRFIIGSVPPGERTLRIDHLGYKPQVLEGIIVRTGRTQELRIELTTAPVAVAGVIVQAERVRLIEPDVSASHDIIVSRELRALPVDRLEQAVELTPGVSGGHFRGGRVGQEVHVVDGMELKNQFEASSQGVGIELSPSALEEIEVITGGFGAQYGSALSGVVSYVTRRGSADAWESRASVLTDEWAPESMFSGFTGLSVSAGGPLSFLGGGATLFVDVLAQGMIDSEPRARGLTCLREEDVEADLAAEIASVRAGAASLLCPYESSMLPHQRGDKFIGFARLDRQIAPNLRFYSTFVRNRVQRELYTSEFRYNPDVQLGQRTLGTLGTLNLDWSRNTPSRAYHMSGRVGLMRLDRYLGAVEPATFDGTRVGGFGFGTFRFLGEDLVRSDIEEQLAAPQPVPGYVEPGGSIGSPYGLAGTGIYFTEGTPHIANWATTDMLSIDLVSEVLGLSGSSMRGGLSTKLYGVESYERTLSHLTGSLPNFARFYPATLSGFSEARIAITDEMTMNVGIRVDAFRSGIDFRANREDFLSPVIDAKWNLSLNPRFGVAMPVPGTNNTAALRFNYGYVSQPPDFRFFLDTTVGDSLRTDIRRQGNPAMSFERGKSFEFGVSSLLGQNAGGSLTLFRKELSHLVTGVMRVGANGEPLFSTDDEGSVQGLELAMRARWSSLSFRASWALQKAVGVASGTDSDSILTGDRRFLEYPLAFDRRHSIDLAMFYGRAAGAESGWSAALTSSIQSGYPVDRIAAAGAGEDLRATYLPWTSTIDMRLSRDLGRLPGCDGCAWRVVADGRNLLGRENVIAVRRDTGGLGPTLGAVRALADAMPAPADIPAESPLYSAGIDLDGNGIITQNEFRLARTAAALSRFDPSLYFGEPRQLRLGIELAF